MGVTTAAILLGEVTREEVAAAIREAYPQVGSDITMDVRENDGGYGFIVFPEPNRENEKDASHRRLMHMPGSICSDYSTVYDGPRTLLSFGYWGSSADILTAVAKRFGGYVLPSDTVATSDPDNWTYVAPPSAVFEASLPEDKMRIELAKILSPKASAQLAELVGQPEKLTRVIAVLEAYNQALVVDCDQESPAPGM